MVKLLVLDIPSCDIFTCDSPIIPRKGDQLPVLHVPYPAVESVTLNVATTKSILHESIKDVLGEETFNQINWDKLEIAAIVTIK